MNKPLTYKDAGVDIDAGDALVERIKPIAKATSRPESLAGLGGFGALFQIPTDRYAEPVLVSGTDGVGTKLRLAIDHNRHETVGIDLVAMCVNDLIVQGAEPLFFLDYFATGKLHVDTAERVIKGIGEGCLQAGCALIGGETAEMPNMYPEGDYDLAGFCVGVVEKSKIISGDKVKAGDVIVGLPSSGPHSNGYSLIRKILDRVDHAESIEVDGRPLLDALMEPTKIYIKPLLNLIAQVDIAAMAHITGGGITENLPRVLPAGLQAVISRSSWQMPPVFKWLQEMGGGIEDGEMLRTFNSGVGMILVVDNQEVDQVLRILQSTGESAFVMGSIQQADAHDKPVVYVP